MTAFITSLIYVQTDYTCAFAAYSSYPTSALLSRIRELKPSQNGGKTSKSLIMIHKQLFASQNSCDNAGWDEVNEHNFLKTIGRRSMIMHSMLLCAATLVPNISAASDDPQSASAIIKPFAPLEALLPATRLRMAIDQAVVLVNEIISMDPTASNFPTRRGDSIARLQHILYDTQPYAPPLSLPKKDSQKSKLYDQVYAKQLGGMSPGEALLALPVQIGERDTAARLKRRQKRLEKNDPIRGAFNFYTSQLQFNTDAYVLNAAGSERKRLIRDDALPDVKSTIVSDLDLRDLLRNQMLDLWEDAAAELRYQAKFIDEGTDEKKFDATELRTILFKLQEICTSWFAFIPEKDVKEAAGAVLNEASTPDTS